MLFLSALRKWSMSMKVKLDFVSNSSSTSFVYISDEELSKEAFMEAAGVDPNSPVAVLFSQMHTELCHGMAYGEVLSSEKEVDAVVGRRDFTPEVIDKMRVSVNEGKKVVIGTLSSDGPLAESLLCMEIFEIKSDRFFLNAYDNYW